MFTRCGEHPSNIIPVLNTQTIEFTHLTLPTQFIPFTYTYEIVRKYSVAYMRRRGHRRIVVHSGTSFVHYHYWNSIWQTVLQNGLADITPLRTNRRVWRGSIASFIFNVLWVLTFGWILALGYLISGLLTCITIIGIPFGIQSFKMMKLAFAPFGANIQPLY